MNTVLGKYGNFELVGCGHQLWRASLAGKGERAGGKGDRVRLLGRNGVGKRTVLRQAPEAV